MSDGTLLTEIEETLQLSSFFNPKLVQQFFEFSLEEVGFPSAEELLNATLEIEKELGGTKGWRTNGKESSTYAGFSLTYNPSNDVDAFSTMGDNRLTQYFSRTEGTGKIEELKNSYFDTYRFSKTHPVIEKHYSSLLSRLNCQLTRARVAYIYPKDETIYNYGYHKDEFIFQNLRINIPLQTSPEYVLEINGEDEFGNSLVLEKHLEVGKCYIWNTRIPHRVYAKSQPSSLLPRIHIVLGVMPWVTVDGDTFKKNEFFGIQPFDLLKRGALFK